MKEIRVCFANKAYKATEILAGAFLEAFLIDWLSEIDGKKYLEESLIIKYKGKDGKEADFVDYIECVKKNYSPK